MNTVLKIVVIPSNYDRTMINHADESIIGKTFSTTAKITVNKVSDGYSILYASDVFKSIDMRKLYQNIRNMLNKNLPNEVVYVENLYLCQILVDGNPGKYEFSHQTAAAIIHLASLFYNCEDDNIQYALNGCTRWVRDKFIDETQGKYTVPDLEDSDDGDDFFEDHDLDDDDEPEFEDFYRRFGKSPLNYGKKSKKKKGYKKGHYSRSKIITHAKHPKKEFDRHGVVIWRDKDDRDRDEKMIKQFLKEFIPGNARWKREFRSDLLDRWMEAFTIKKKKLQRLERKMRKSKEQHKRKKISAAESIAMGLSSRIMQATNTYDPWNNPNK